MDEMWKKKLICMVISIVAGFLVTGGVIRGRALAYKMEETQKGLAEEVFRFHVLANSNSEADQELKLKVRDGIISYMKEQLSEDADKEETRRWARRNLNQLENVAKEIIINEGFAYDVDAKVEMISFPKKTYGDITFPAGDYEALRILIGDAVGNNWWCVLYPNLCFVDSIHAVVPKEEKEELKEVLTDEEYEVITVGTKFKIKWFFLGQ